MPKQIVVRGGLKRAKNLYRSMENYNFLSLPSKILNEIALSTKYIIKGLFIRDVPEGYFDSGGDFFLDIYGVSNNNAKGVFEGVLHVLSFELEGAPFFVTRETQI